MGEAWSDYYAMDYLVTKGLRPDTAAPARSSRASTCWPAKQPFRTEAIDCPVETTAPGCTAAITGATRRLHLRRLPDHRRSAGGALLG